MYSSPSDFFFFCLSWTILGRIGEVLNNIFICIPGMLMSLWPYAALYDRASQQCPQNPPTPLPNSFRHLQVARRRMPSPAGACGSRKTVPPDGHRSKLQLWNSKNWWRKRWAAHVASAPGGVRHTSKTISLCDIRKRKLWKGLWGVYCTVGFRRGLRWGVFASHATHQRVH